MDAAHLGHTGWRVDVLRSRPYRPPPKSPIPASWLPKYRATERTGQVSADRAFVSLVWTPNEQSPARTEYVNERGPSELSIGLTGL